MPSTDAPRELAGAVALVTGANRGLGRHLALALAEAGAVVAAHHRGGEEDITAAIAAAGGEARAFTAELTDPAARRALVGDVVDALGRLDVVVANAATQPLSPLAEVTDEEVAAVLATNLAAPLALTRDAAAVLPPGGAVVHVASIEAWHPLPAHAHYAASKAGLVALVRAAAHELGPAVRVNGVAPGLVAREGLEVDWPEGVARYAAASALDRLVDPDEVADVVRFLAGPASRGVTGVTIPVDGGVTSGAGW